MPTVSASVVTLGGSAAVLMLCAAGNELTVRPAEAVPRLDLDN